MFDVGSLTDRLGIDSRFSLKLNLFNDVLTSQIT